MAKKRAYIVVEINPVHLKVLTFDASSETLRSSMVRDISSLRDKPRDEFIVKTIREALHEDAVISGAGTRGVSAILAKGLSSIKPNDGAPASIVGALTKSLQVYAAKQVLGILCLADDSVHIKRVELPYMPLNEIREALKWRVKGLLPFEAENAVLDFDIINEFTDEDGAKKYSIILAAVEKKEVDMRLALMKEAGINMIGSVNVGSFGLSNLLKQTPEGKSEKTCAVLNVGYIRSIVNIYKGAKLVFSRTIPIGVNHIKDSIKNPIIVEVEPVDLTSEEIKKLKEIGMPDNKESLLGGRLQGKHLLAYMRPVLENLCSEIRRSLDYYNAHLEGKEASKIYLVGDGLRYRNLDLFIGDLLKIETGYLDFSSPVKDNMPRLVSLIGAAIGGKGAKVNLMPVEYGIEKSEKIQKVSIRMVGFAAFSALLVSFILVNTRVNDYEERLLNVKGQLKILDEVKVMYENIIEREGLVRFISSSDAPNVSILKE
ncbi:MAG: pilus assembly protein PilM, partial [Candidatus Omnitrophota bacterium]